MPALDVIVPDRWCAFRRVFGACIMQPTSGSRECGFETRRDLPDGIFRGLRKNLVDAARPSDDDCSRAMAFVAWSVERGIGRFSCFNNFGAAMKILLVLPLLFALAGDDPEAAKAQRERLYKLHLGDALEFTIYRDADRHEPLEFRKQPIYVWTNVVRVAHQDGLVFLWTSRGVPRRSGRSFRRRTGQCGGSRTSSTRSRWERCTSTAGGRTTPLGHSAGLASSLCRSRALRPRPLRPRNGWGRCGRWHASFRRRPAMRRDNRYTLRLLSQPLYRYESTDPEVLDGALFAFVTSAGTDPECFW